MAKKTKEKLIAKRNTLLPQKRKELKELKDEERGLIDLIKYDAIFSKFREKVENASFSRYLAPEKISSHITEHYKSKLFKYANEVLDLTVPSDFLGYRDRVATQYFLASGFSRLNKRYSSSKILAKIKNIQKEKIYSAK